ncbi:MAG: hypothetical protein K2Q09_04480, partial [Phycisphaerales bacterium]|nr:hypothetical protein [Phycisphaerales bacterium]
TIAASHRSRGQEASTCSTDAVQGSRSTRAVMGPAPGPGCPVSAAGGCCSVWEGGDGGRLGGEGSPTARCASASGGAALFE